MATALVIGNMIGSGIFMLPSTLARTSGPGATMIAWGITGLGSIFLALSFGKLGSAIPKTGGPYEHSKLAFGDLTGFLNAWLYWNGCWIGNAAIIIAVTSCIAFVFPVVGYNNLIGFVVSTCILWGCTIINILGVKTASKIQSTSTVIKMSLFLVFIIVAARNFDFNNIRNIFPQGKGVGTIPAAATATLWAFTGLETATVTGGEIKNPEKNIKRATILGILIATVFYMAISFFAMGAMKSDALALSNTPIIDILAIAFGGKVGKYIAVLSFVSIGGTAIGWLLSTARISYAASMGGVFPKSFSKIHKKFKTPYISLIIGSVLVNILLIMNFTKGLSGAFSFVALFATLSYLPVFAIACANEIFLLNVIDGKVTIFKFIKKNICPIIGFVYAMWTIYGAGAEIVMYGFLLILMGIPFYLYMHEKNRTSKNEEQAQNIA